MKQTIARLKAILSTNLHYFVTSSLVSAVIYIVLALAFDKSSPFFSNLVFTRHWLLFVIGAFFLLPSLIYLSFAVSQYSYGVTGKQINAKIVKRHLFLAAGVMWISVGCFAMAKLAGSLDYMLFAASVVGLLSWVIMFRLFFGYVRTL